jgi:ferrous iron transport protein B
MSADPHCAPRRDDRAKGPATKDAANGRARDAGETRGVTVALVGRPNSGKSSLYNRLTGGNARVGNYPGITVDVLEAITALPSGKNVTIADLPGLYSVEATIAADTDEGVAKTFLDRLRTEKKGLLVVQVIDPTRLALGLRLSRELLLAKLPLIVVLTHADVLQAEGRGVDVERLRDAIGAPVVLVSARDSTAKQTVLAAIDDEIRNPHEAEGRSFDPAALARQVATEVGSSAAIVRRRLLTTRLDRVLLHPLVGPFVFVGLMALVFASVFLVADPVTGVFDKLVTLARGWLDGFLGKGLLASLLANGILAGAGTVLAFMPQIVILTVALEVLEASGYLARGAFLVDRLLGLLGLSGRSFLPLLMGHACAIPAISATRVVRDPRERLTTILVLPLMTCSARLPTYGLVLATFFGGRSALFRACLFVGLYFSGIFAALVASWILRRTATKGRSLPLVLEMPAYRVPQASVVARKAWQSARRFLRDVGRTIVIVSVVLWALLTIRMPGVTRPTDAPPIESSIAATVGRTLEPVTRPAGFDWRINVGLIGSFGAREVMVATMGIVFGVEDVDDDPAPLVNRLREAQRADGTPLYGVRNGLALLAFFVLACQCMSTVAAIKRETGSWRWPAFVIGYTYSVAYIAAVLVYQVAGALGVP